MTNLLAETPILDYNHPSLQDLVTQKKWQQLDPYNQIGAIYTFVQNEILFGYNEADNISASHVLADGYGQCNTKSNLLMALLRAVGIPCRFHGFTIDKALQEGAITGLWYKLAPQNIIHSWVEVYYDERWINLEGFIIDEPYLANLQKQFSTVTDSFCGYGVATTNLQNPAIHWKGEDTYIQKEGINQDFGIFDTPDEFYMQYGVNLRGVKRPLFKHLARHRMNAQVTKIRNGAFVP